MPGSTFGHGLIRKLWSDWSKYRYDKNGQTYDVSAPGAEIVVLLGFSARDKVNVGLKLGVEKLGELNSQAYLGIELGGIKY